MTNRDRLFMVILGLLLGVTISMLTGCGPDEPRTAMRALTHQRVIMAQNAQA